MDIPNSIAFFTKWLTLFIMPEKVNGNKFSGKSNIASLNSNHSPIDSKSAVQLNSTEQKLATIQKIADNSPYSQRFAQLKSLANKTMPSKQPVSQLSKDSHSLPDNVKQGVESLSGISMDDVKVHYNSAKPAQLNAHAYAQGTDKHVASGQEKHLPHEAWHVVQQKQGRVRPTTMMKAKVPVNDDQGLEKEADVMGARALQMKPFSLSDYRTGKSFQRKGVVQKLDVASGNLLGDYDAEAKENKEVPMGNLLGDYDIEANENKEVHIPAGASEELVEDTTATVGPFTYEGGKVSMDLLGQKISLDNKGAELELPSKNFEMNLPGLNINLDIPLHAGVYATAGLTITPRLNITFSGGTAGLTSKILSISDVGIKGEMGLDIIGKVGAGVGLANVVGLEAGAFVGLGGAANLSGSLGGEVNFKDNTSTVNLGLNGSASIIGKAGIFGRAKFLAFELEKQFTLAETEFGIFKYSKNGEYSNGWSHLMPKIDDFYPTKLQNNLELNHESIGLV